MQFVVRNTIHCISSPRSNESQVVTHFQMEKLLQNEKCARAFLFIIQEESSLVLNDSSLSLSQDMELKELLDCFVGIFQTLTTLSPRRSHDHKIPLLPRSKPPNARPYKYGPFQKFEIEKSVKELLDSGFIRASNSPFYSPVLFVKKKKRHLEIMHRLQSIEYADS